MKSKIEIRNWILKNCMVGKNIIDLSRLDFTGIDVYLTELKAKNIYNNSQIAFKISNAYQEATEIDNECQETLKKCPTCLQKLKGDKDD